MNPLVNIVIFEAEVWGACMDSREDMEEKRRQNGCTLDNFKCALGEMDNNIH